MREYWVPIKGYGSYLVSTCGNVYSLKCKRLIQPEFTHNGYLRVKLIGDDGKRKSKRIHLLVAGAWMGDRPEGCEIDHNNDVRHHNHVDNLEWVSRNENLRRKRERYKTFKQMQVMYEVKK